MEIVTQRLILRELQESDYAAMRQIRRMELVQRYEDVEIPDEAKTREEHDEALRRAKEEPRIKYYLGVTIPPSDRVVGRISFRLNTDWMREWEIGWFMHPDYWSKGYAAEGAQAVLRFAFEDLHVHRVIAFCNALNKASYRVMEKLGMTREGVLRETLWWNGKWVNEYLYAILEKDWAKTIG